jgi:23S rRNA pseudouridine2605 synthase
VEKTYLAEIHGPIPRDLGRRLRAGVRLDDGPAKADRFRIFDQVGKRVLVEITLHEGRKHIVRRMLKEVGFPVQQLARVQFGPVRLGQLRPGTMRALTVREIGELYKAVGL